MSQSFTQSASIQKETPNTGKWALLALAINAFGIGTTEFVPVGLLASIADDLSIGITLAGLLISGYAVGVALGAPILTALTNRMSRKLLHHFHMVYFSPSVQRSLYNSYLRKKKLAQSRLCSRG